MSAADQKQFTDAVASRKTSWIQEDWAPAVHALNRLAMFDMLPALAAIPKMQQDAVPKHVLRMVGIPAYKRVLFANIVVQMREIPDWTGSLSEEQINDGRVYLGCTRLDDAGIKRTIDDALGKARSVVSTIPDFANESCCGVYRYAWLKVLVPKRQAPGGSLISNLAAAAHYMLTRYHVCSAKATVWQMKLVVKGYDMKKRAAISRGDVDLKSMALTANRPFPPDFAIQDWAFKGADEGERDYWRCNSATSRPWVAPTINQSEWGE